MLVGITGRAGSGKDTIASVLAEHIPAVRIMRFSEPIKQICRDVFGWQMRHTDGDMKDVVDPITGVMPRVAMQTLGTDWGRNLRSDVWIQLLLRRYVDAISRARVAQHGHSSVIDQVHHVIVPDVRFIDEARAICDHGGYLIHVSRGSVQQMQHASEVECDSAEMQAMCDFVVSNNHDISHLRHTVSIICDVIQAQEGGDTDHR